MRYSVLFLVFSFCFLQQQTSSAESRPVASPANSSINLAKSPTSSTKKRVQAPLELRILLSETCGFVEFVETISNRPHKTDWVKNWFFEQRGDEAKFDKEVCAKYSKFLDELGAKYQTADEVGRWMTLSQRISCLAVDCETLDELLKKLKPILAPKDYVVFEETYKRFYPFYHSRVWEPRHDRLKVQLEEFRLGAAACRMTQKLEQVQLFMKAKWPAKLSMDIVLVPLPSAKQTSSHADSIGKTQIVELQDKYVFADHADVLFHELCHALWGRKKDLARVSQEFQKIDGETAYIELNEGLATALGQGWFRQSSFPDLPQMDSWYSNSVTEAYARGLCPLVTEYLGQGRCFDNAFVQRASKIFDEKCGFAKSHTQNKAP